MPRIRKRTSNRQSLNTRYRKQHKIKEGRKKKRKEAKKSTQWKSKHKKDPGIPNDFPFKDQILAEVAEQRRIAAEEKEQRKRDKKANNGSLPTSDAQTSMEVDDTHDENAPPEPLSEMKSSDVDGDAIASISAKVIDPKRATIRKKVGDVETVLDEEEEEAPILMNHEVLGAVLDKSDVLLQVLDARDPLAFRSSYLEKAMKGKKVLLVLNKIDTCPRESTSAWLTFLRREHPTFLFRSATAFLPAAALQSSNPVQGTGKSKASSHRKDDAWGSEAILTQLANWATEKNDGSPLNVAVVGLTNAGKSSFLNSLLHKEALPVYTLSTASRNPTTSVLPQEITIETQGKPIRFNDTPGLIWSTGSEEGGSVNPESESDNLRIRDILMRSRGRIDRLKDPLPVVSHIVSRANTEDLMVMYGLPAFKSGDGTAFLSGVARSNRLVKKRGELDLSAASRIVLRDWNGGKFVRFTVPHGDKSVSLELSEADKEVLECVKTRKEMRRSGGLVRLVASGMEDREVDLERPWTWIGKEGESSDDDDGEEEEDEYDEGEDDEMELDEEEDDDEEDDDISDEDDKHPEPEPEPEIEFKTSAKSATQKRKRAASLVSEQPLTKKVAFASVGPDKASRIHQDQKQQQQQQKQKEGLGRPQQVVKSILKKGKKQGGKSK
ncbi:hypothetical protein Agabi119p4_5197 [Agaricus bisporus var. burnettii]|uniref:CP-type G domain-containing protein n=1 Tax=Agaricus bisporus var. burnettii TaxID=192524 RepID=A0A8H7KHN6_AGABI|nr:hypothetical protein Agabi119p4_5197 [Agaricus bisporus var. burnettii]